MAHPVIIPGLAGGDGSGRLLTSQPSLVDNSRPSEGCTVSKVDTAEEWHSSLSPGLHMHKCTTLSTHKTTSRGAIPHLLSTIILFLEQVLMYVLLCRYICEANLGLPPPTTISLHPFSGFVFEHLVSKWWQCLGFGARLLEVGYWQEWALHTVRILAPAPASCLLLCSTRTATTMGASPATMSEQAQKL